MKTTRLAVRAAAALTMLAIAAPALPCGDAKQTSATNAPAPTATPKDAVAKQSATPAKVKGQKAGGAKKATAAN